MKTILKQELFKLTRQRVPLLTMVVLLGLMLYTSLPTANITKYLVAQGFGLTQWVLIIMIAVSANQITMEFRDHTMPTMLYKSANKSVPYMAKLVALMLMGVALLAVGAVFVLILQALLARRFSWTMNLAHHSLWLNFVAGLGGTTIYLLFIITLGLLLVSLAHSNALVIIIGLAIGFLGANLSAVLLEALPSMRATLAWNPLNMINIIHPLSNNVKYVYLSGGQLVIGNLIYSAIFLLLGLWIFKRSRI